jgi:glycosyltransferase involved in cell wall biosynthesis
MPRKTMPGLMAACQIGLQSLDDVRAFQEGTSPNKLMDYLSAGLPVAITYQGWSARMVLGAGAGIAPAREPSTFAAALVALAEDAVLRTRMGAAARQLAEARFDRARLAEKFCAVVEAAAAGERRVAPLAPLLGA